MADSGLIAQCRQKLLAAKADLLNRIQSHLNEFRERDHGGDEADQTTSLQVEHRLFAAHQRLRQQVMEVESALARIERGTFGICEETDQPIEPDRLLTLPWTRLSIEGAEMREAAARLPSQKPAF